MHPVFSDCAETVRVTAFGSDPIRTVILYHIFHNFSSRKGAITDMVDQYGRWFPDYPGQQPYMDPQFARVQGQQSPQTIQPTTAPQPRQSTFPASMTLPTIHAEIVQVDGETAAAQYPVGAGMSQMMISRDESAIFVKNATANGYTLEVFEKRPPAPQPATFNPDEYVRLSELPEIVAAEVQAALAAMQPAKPARKKNETEVTAE